MRHLALVLVLLTALAACGHSKNHTDPNVDVVFSPVPSTLLVAAVGSSFSQTVTVTSGGTQPFVFTLDTAPAGLTLAAVDSFSATLSGTPTVAGLSTIQITVVDALKRTTFVPYQIQVKANSAPALAISPTTIVDAFQPQTYTQFFTVSGGVAPFAWSESGALPPNLVFHPTTGASCDISGVPVQAGSFTFTLTVTDSSVPQRTGTATITLNVR